jgi:DNA-binding NtrC family response regulator
VRVIAANEGKHLQAIVDEAIRDLFRARHPGGLGVRARDLNKRPLSAQSVSKATPEGQSACRLAGGSYGFMVVSAQHHPRFSPFSAHRPASPEGPGRDFDSSPPPSSRASALVAPRGFEAFDDALVGPREGVALVLSPSREVGRAHAEHAARRLEATYSVIAPSCLGPTPLFIDVASQLGLRGLADDPAQAARQLARALHARRAALVAPLPALGSWDRAVFIGLCGATDMRAHVLMFAAFTDVLEEFNEVDVFELSAELSTEEAQRWWHALSESNARKYTDRDAVKLARWATLTQRRSDLAEMTPSALAPVTLAALGTLDAVGRAWPTSLLGALGIADGQVDELAAEGLVRVSAGHVSVRDASSGIAPSAIASSQVADALVAHFDDPWSKARAADLLILAAEYDRADQTFSAALAMLADGGARNSIAARWRQTVNNIDDVAWRETLAIAQAERSIASGEAELAAEWAQLACQLTPDGPRATYLHGKAMSLTGEHALANAAFQRALPLLAPDHPLVVDIQIELAELSLLERDLARATEVAESVLRSSASESARLASSNLLGKLMLAKADWAGALERFSRDEERARGLGLRLEGLRARINRAVALLSMGRLPEAQELLLGALVEADQLGSSQAKAFTLGNLVTAYNATDQGKALDYAEAACNMWVRLGNRRQIVRTLANVIALRLHVGLVDQAASALAFSKKYRFEGLPASALTFWQIVTARVMFSQGKWSGAVDEVRNVIAVADPGEGAVYLAEAHRLLAAVALEEGTLSIAGDALDAAAQHDTDARGRSQHALLVARLDIARGTDAIASAQAALELARRAHADDLVVEAHAWLGRAHLNRGDVAAAQSHLNCAIALRDELAERLVSPWRAAFLARAEFAVVGQLQRLLAGSPSPVTPAVSRERSTVKREIVGDDPAIRALLAAVKRVARTSATVLVRGESGTGKELLAEAIHRGSDRAHGPLVTVNCAALVETLLLSELFGHEKGAFTGATNRKRGRFELAEGGTLFLDEIGDISPRTQVALLRVLQEKTYERVGGTVSLRANVRIVCATHRDLRTMVERGEFREDLYYRLRGIILELPALRSRMGDLPRIAENLLARIAQERAERPKTLSDEAAELLTRHRWPGNVRELENALRVAALFSDSDVIDVLALTDNVDELRSLASQGPSSLRPTLRPPGSTFDRPASGAVDDRDDDSGTALVSEEARATTLAYEDIRQGNTTLFDLKRQIERDCIARALAETKGNITRAAVLLGMKRPRLSQLVKQYGFAAVSSEDGL